MELEFKEMEPAIVAGYEVVNVLEDKVGVKRIYTNGTESSTIDYWTDVWYEALQKYGLAGEGKMFTVTYATNLQELDGQYVQNVVIREVPSKLQVNCTFLPLAFINFTLPYKVASADSTSYVADFGTYKKIGAPASVFNGK